MIKVNISTIDERKSVIVDSALSPKEILQQENISMHGAVLMLDGLILQMEDIHTPLAEMGLGDECSLAVTIKMDNA